MEKTMEYTQLEEERMHQMLLSPHFALDEFIKSGTAQKRGIDNVPPSIIVIVRLMTLCEEVLEPLRKRYGAIYASPTDTVVNCSTCRWEASSTASIPWARLPTSSSPTRRR